VFLSARDIRLLAEPAWRIHRTRRRSLILTSPPPFRASFEFSQIRGPIPPQPSVFKKFEISRTERRCLWAGDIRIIRFHSTDFIPCCSLSRDGFIISRGTRVGEAEINIHEYSRVQRRVVPFVASASSEMRYELTQQRSSAYYRCVYLIKQIKRARQARAALASGSIPAAGAH